MGEERDNLGFALEFVPGLDLVVGIAGGDLELVGGGGENGASSEASQAKDMLAALSRALPKGLKVHDSGRVVLLGRARDLVAALRAPRR